MGSWAIGRLIVFPACCVYSALIGPSIALESNLLTEFQIDILMLPYRWMGYMLVGLQFLQIFWTYYIGKAFV